MGLSASQARLLTITSRKSDCEFQSMQLSHEKLSISRDLAILSNQYQASLNQTKLMYDYYGTGSGMEQLNYNTFMTPSALNDFRPITMTNSLNRVILDSRYASAAREAGIPQEGLGCTPSSLVRTQFYQGLANAGLITASEASSYADSPYYNTLGLGDSSPENIITVEQGDMEELRDRLAAVSIGMNLGGDITVVTGKDSSGNLQTTTASDIDIQGGSATFEDIKLSELLSNDPNDQINFVAITNDNNQWPIQWVLGLATDLTATGGFIDQLYDAFATVLTNGYPKSTLALNEARYRTMELFHFSVSDVEPSRVHHDEGFGNGIDTVATATGFVEKKPSVGEVKNNILDKAGDIVGIAYNRYTKGGKIGKKFNSACGVNLNNIARAFLTYFLDAYNGYSTDDTKNESYTLKRGFSTSELIGDNVIFDFPGETITEGNEYASRMIEFYDSLLNQIATSGWAENNEVHDPKYLQDMIQNGMMYITNMSDDGFYYQRNYQTYSYVKEVSDESEIAKAEADYKANKEKLNMKEQKLDLKMKNLDTEISTLTTEYDTVKNLISKNIEKGFKRYSA